MRRYLCGRRTRPAGLMKTLYICYFALREPLVQTQVLPYLRELSESGIEIYLLTFEQARKTSSADEIEQDRLRLRTEGIRWFSLSYHKRPSVPATLYDILAGARLAAKLVRQHKIEVLHARAHVPMAMAMLAKRLGSGSRLLFDIRGLMAEEYADAGIWTKNSPGFLALKRIERTGIREADQVVVLTRKFRDWLVEHKLKPRERIEVIPCCVDLALSGKPDEEGEGARAANRFEVIYAGSVTGLYLLEEMGLFFLELLKRRRDAYFRILTVSSATDAAERLMNVGLNSKDFHIGAVPPADVRKHLGRARIGLSFRKPSFSQIAASPTKIPEYLAAGLPIVCNTGIGDTDELLLDSRVGVLLRAFDERSYQDAADKALVLADDPDMRARCERLAREKFDLVEVGGIGYRNVYQHLKEEKAAVDATG